MPYYACRIAAEDGRVTVRSVLASTADECRKTLESEGGLVLSVRRDWNRLEAQGISFGRKIKDKDIILFNQELVALIKAGYPILKSLDAITARVRNVYLKEILIKVAGEVRLGKALSEAFLPYEPVFGTVYTASLMAGEKSGNLPGTIGRFIQYARVISQTKARIRSAMTYPTILLVFSLILMSLLINFVLPQFADFYQSFEAEMPALTRALMSAAGALNAYWFLPLGALAVVAAVALRMRKRPGFRSRLDKVKLRVPFGRTIWLESSISLFSRTLGLLLEAGISLLTAVGVAIQAVPNAYLAGRMKDVGDHIRNGETLSASLARSEALPDLALDMVRIGETSANLQGMLGDMADFYDERVRGKIDTLVSLIEPVVIIFMGLVVAGMLLAVYVPIFNVIRIAR
jgi:type IV pilus assembly protein PilC